MWREAARYRVRDQKGVVQFVVEMTTISDKSPTTDKGPQATGGRFYFLLDGQDVQRVADGTFVNLATGEILVPLAE